MLEMFLSLFLMRKRLYESLGVDGPLLDCLRYHVLKRETGLGHNCLFSMDQVGLGDYSILWKHLLRLLT